ncbi:MAG: hypothetical protein ACOYXW_06515 [Actinomycetota bacterium]
MGLRLVVAVAVLVSAAVHLWLWFDGFRVLDVIGPAFMVNAVAGVVIAVALVVWRHWLPLLAAVGFGAATFGAFLVSTTVGLFGVREPFFALWPMVANTSEIVAVVVGVGALLRERRAVRTGQAVRT